MRDGAPLQPLQPVRANSLGVASHPTRATPAWVEDRIRNVVVAVSLPCRVLLKHWQQPVQVHCTCA
eukprot:366083-Chlamydomonas_euryale.AAC.4